MLLPGADDEALLIRASITGPGHASAGVSGTNGASAARSQRAGFPRQRRSRPA
jgi:hypothetical protein